MLLACAFPGFSQPVMITGIGLSASLTGLDSLATAGDTLSIVISFDREVGFDVRGLALSADTLDFLTLHFYLQDEPQGGVLSTTLYDVPGNSVTIDTVNVPNELRFDLILHGDANALARSLQMEARLFGYANQVLYVSDPRSSHAQVGGTPPVNNPVDPQHATFLRWRDIQTLPPTLILPPQGGILNRDFPVRFLLPEDAAPGTLDLTFEVQDATEPLRHVYLHNTSADTARQVRLNAANLVQSPDVDSVSGPVSLTHLQAYRLDLSYRDLALNPVATDSVTDLRVDILSETPSLIEPARGATAPVPRVRVIYELLEMADTLQLVFTVDSLSPVPDPLSPHILTLVPEVYGPGIQAFSLDGTLIGTGGPYVLFSNNGVRDSLAWGGLYSVKLVYGDTLNNPSVSVSNDGYSWPRDMFTMRPQLIDPQPGTRENASLWVQFRLPEEAYPGSVQLTIRTFSGFDPGSPHVLTFPTLAAPGIIGFFLAATAFSTSDLHPDVQGGGTFEENNTLVHNVRYRVRISYQDALGNPAASDSLSNGFITFDIATDPPEIVAPHTGDTLSLSGTTVNIHLPEFPLPGSSHLILTQISGPDPDPLSPHTLFLDDSLGIFYGPMLLLPGSLANSTHVDSVRNNTPLVARGHYRLTLEYQDTMSNPSNSTALEDLYMPSGSAVFVQGRGFGPQLVQPGVTNNVVFQLGLRTLGGASLLRGLRFFNDGELAPADVVANQCYVWSSSDSVFDPAFDTIAGTLTDWPSGYVRFANLGVSISDFETHVFVTLTYSTAGDQTHRVNLFLDGPQGVDCGGDPVYASSWPIGEPDVPLFVNLLSFTTEQDTAFGALRLRWTVGSEVNNEGFNVLRRADSDSAFSTVASFTNTPSLVGRGTAPSGWSYGYVDRGLTPGQTYHYRLQAVTSENYIAELLDLETSGIPRLPPNDFILSSAYPNPFNQDVTIEYVVPYSSVVELTIYDVLGREVRTLVRNLLPPSLYHARWDSRDNFGTVVPSGLYFYRFRADNGRFEKTKKLLLIR
jgi:hypothetical protein